MSKEPTKSTAFRIPLRILEHLQARAEEEGRSLSQIIIRLLDKATKGGK
jgi:predicted DNA-binding protein